MRLIVSILVLSLPAAACSPDRDAPVGNHGQREEATWHYEGGSAWFGLPNSELQASITCTDAGNVAIHFAVEAEQKGKPILLVGKVERTAVASEYTGWDDPSFHYLDAEVPGNSPVLADIVKHKSYRLGIGDDLGPAEGHPAVLRAIGDCVRK